MFHKPTVKDKNIITVSSSMSAIPEETQENDRQVLEQLLALVKLIGQKYTIENVKGRFNRSTPNEVSVVLFDGAFVRSATTGMENENKRPIEFLKSFGGNFAKDEGSYPHLSSTVFIINQAKCSEIIQGLKLLVTPSHEEAENRSHSRMMAKC